MIEKNPALELVEVFMVKYASLGGSAKYEGNIYQLERYNAEKLAEDGSAILVDVDAYKAHKAKIEKLSEQLQDEVTEINNNHRLSPEGKKEDVEAVLNKYQIEAEKIQEAYANQLSALKKSELSKMQEIPTDAKLSPDEARTQAGLFRSELAMIDTFEESVQFIKTRLEVLDRNVVRELLAVFVEIKKELEEKQENSKENSGTSNAYLKMKEKGGIMEIYEMLKEASYGPGQAQSVNKYKMLDALEKQRGDIRSDLNMKVTAIKRTHNIQ